MLPAILLPDLYDIEAIGHELLEYALASETGARDRDLKNPVMMMAMFRTISPLNSSLGLEPWAVKRECRERELYRIRRDGRS